MQSHDALSTEFSPEKKSGKKPPVRAAQKLESFPARSLIPNARNTRVHSDAQVEQIAASIREFGFTRPILVDEARNVLAGHGALAAAKRLGMESVPCVVLSGLSEAQKRAYIIADNKLALNASWDDSLLAIELQELDAIEFDLGVLGFSVDELDDLLGTSSTSTSTTVVAPVGVFDREDIVSEAFAWFRETGFPYERMPLFVMKQQINALAALDHETLTNSIQAHRVADAFHPHRFASTAIGMRSPLDTFNSDKYLRVALEKQIEYHGKIPAGYFWWLALAEGGQMCGNFRPGIACAMYREFAGENATVLDTSTGYGGRLVGAIAAGNVAQYIGVDPNTLTHAGNRCLARAFGWHERVTLHCLPAEDVRSEIADECADFALTSPPYFAKEQYSDEPTQSCNRYGDFVSWVDGFLRPMLALQFRALKHGAVSVINVADVKIRSETIELEKATKHCALAAGFELLEVRDVRFGNSAALYDGAESDVSNDEPFFVLRKP